MAAWSFVVNAARFHEVCVVVRASNAARTRFGLGFSGAN
jgi:hypothetical protein